MWGTNVRWTTCISHTETQMQCWKATLMLFVCLFAGLCVRNTHCTKTWRCCCWTLALCARQSSVAESLRYRRRKSSNLSSAINKRSRLPLVTEPMTSAWLKARDSVLFYSTFRYSHFHLYYEHFVFLLNFLSFVILYTAKMCLFVFSCV